MAHRLLLVLLIAMTLGARQVAADEAAPAQVVINNYTFSPDVVQVAAGASVVWVNHDEALHSVQSKDKAFASKPLDTNETFRYTFSKPGTYQYLCGFHPHMTGTVIVK